MSYLTMDQNSSSARRFYRYRIAINRRSWERCKPSQTSEESIQLLPNSSHITALPYCPNTSKQFNTSSPLIIITINSQSLKSFIIFQHHLQRNLQELLLFHHLKMDVELPSFTILLTIILFTIVFLKLKKTNSKLPPGPWKLPVIGNMHQLALGLPHHVLRDLAMKYGPLMHLKLGEVSAVVVSSPETAKQVMKTHDIAFASRPPILASKILSYDCKGIVASPYGEYWRQLRKVCIVELLSARQVQSFHSLREEEISNLVRWIASNAGSSINLTEKVISTSFNVISRAAFGKKSKEHETFISIIKEVIRAAEGFNIADIYPSIKFLHYMSGEKPKLERLKSQVDRILGNIIHEHATRKSSTIGDEQDGYENVVDVLLKYLDKETGFSLTTDHIKAVLLDIFGAGGETSSTTVDWAMCEMLKNPNILKKAQDEVRQVFNSKGYVDEANFHELKYLKAVINETLRLHSPLPLLVPRECREACEINGYEIPMKTKVIVNAWAIARDPKYWKDPEYFKPERFLTNSIDYKGTYFEYIPFGAGRRICPGMSFGLASVELSLVKFLYHFDWNLPNGMKNEELDMTEAHGLTTIRKDDLYVIPVIHNPSAE